MGSAYKFTCPQCQYSAEVSGGRDFGFVAVVQTMICEDCESLVDVLIGSFGQNGPIGDPDYDKDLNICPLCKGKNVHIWKNDLLCPKCNTRMENEGIEILWD